MTWSATKLIINFIFLAIWNTLSKPKLQRTPEPNPISDLPEQVDAYNRVFESKLALHYALIQELILRCSAHPIKDFANLKVLDLACGPGLLTLQLSKNFNFKKITGLDLSTNMIQQAQLNKKKYDNLSGTEFINGSVLDLSSFETNSLDVVIFADAAHHFNSLGTIENIFSEMDRITKPDGLIIIADLVRLKNKEITDYYIRLLGQDYLQKGLSYFYNDFCLSMYAAWTIDELNEALPKKSQKQWRHLSTLGLPTSQIILGLPSHQKKTVIHRSKNWPLKMYPLSENFFVEWSLLKFSIFFLVNLRTKFRSTTNQRVNLTP